MSESTTAVEVVKTAVAKVENGDVVALEDLLKVLAPTPAGAKVPSRLPLPAAIKDTERKALERLPEVFGKIVPTERRALQPAEISALVEEKETLDAIEKMAKDRKAKGIKVAIYNHFDVVAESEEGFDPDVTLRDGDGHYVLDQAAEPLPGTAKTFKRETRGGAPSLDAQMLKNLAEDPNEPGFTHEDYLAMTTQVRVIDENKVMLALQKKPTLMAAIAKATKPGNKTTALNLRTA